MRPVPDTIECAVADLGMDVLFYGQTVNFDVAAESIEQTRDLFLIGVDRLETLRSARPLDSVRVAIGDRIYQAAERDRRYFRSA